MRHFIIRTISRFFLLVIIPAAFSQSLSAQINPASSRPSNSFDLFDATIYYDAADFPLVQKTVSLFQQDLEMLSGKKPILVTGKIPSSKNIIIIGSITQSSIIQQLIHDKKINITAIDGKWEGYITQAIRHPYKGVDNALVIAGSDRRGTAYGVFDLSKKMGVSPWYWWADVPVKKNKTFLISNSTFTSDAPKVKYRGIFINDEAPALSNWSREKFGGFNHHFYEKVFELILRLKGNYLWPAMWGNAFYDDDSLNIRSADEYGIVIGTSHHEPLMRAHDEWRRYGNKQKWNYDSTESGLKAFWRKGMQRATNEKIVSIGMRGDGDEPMTRETATALLERIVKDQRQIIEEVTGKPAAATPQLWALYKEVQDYYDKGMRVPDDVTLLLCDDNWGNIRKLPRTNEKPRAGGYGIYYHFDYVGDPRNYKWLNTNPLPRVWEQMHMAWEYNVRQIWIVNVGDIKPMEFPISFFLDYAWNPDKIDIANLQAYTNQWCVDQFGKKYGEAIGNIISTYSKYNGRRKPELLDDKTYSIDHYDEFEKVVDDYDSLLRRAEKINSDLPASYRDAYFQLVLHPVSACANLNEMYYNVAMNKWAAASNDASANDFADKVKELYAKDSIITQQYHRLANGKWNHMMDQTHIGYTYWQQPPVNKMPEIKYITGNGYKDYAMVPDSSGQVARRLIPPGRKGNIFFEYGKCVSIGTAHTTSQVNSKNNYWKVLPDLGKTGDAITSSPVTQSVVRAGGTTPHVSYECYTSSTGDFTINAYFSPTLNFHNSETGIRYAISVDDELPHVISINQNDKDVNEWKKWVAYNIIITTSKHHINQPGRHTVHYWLVDAGAVLQKIVLDFGGVQQSYLGPPETILKK